MSKNCDQKKYPFYCEAIDVLVGTVLTIIGFLLLRSFDFATVSAVIILFAIFVLYGMFFNDPVMDWLEKKLKT
jgi:hypothetical protein